MKFQYECPECGADVEAKDGDKEATCKECQRRYTVDWDAEFEGGRWRDLTQLHPV